MKKISVWFKKNWVLITIIIIFLLLNNLNYLAGFLFSVKSTDLIYGGAPTTNIGDYNVYLSYIQQGWQGHLFMKILYNPASRYLLFSPIWFLIGQFNRLTDLNIIFSYHLFRALLSLVFIGVLYWWLKKIFNQKWLRLSALAFILFSNGFGLFFLNILHHYQLSPSNQWIPESITFLNLNQGPLFIISQALLLLVFSLFIKAWQERRPRLLFWACLANLFLGLNHPYDLVTIMCILLIFTTWEYLEKRQIKIIFYYAALGISTLLAGAYLLYLLKDPSMQQYQAQNILLSKNIWEYIFGFGALTVLSLLGIFYVLKQKLYINPHIKLLAIWALCGWVLVYLPLDFNRRLSNGWHIALAAISFLAIIQISKKINFYWRLIFLGFIMSVCLFDTLGHIINDVIITRDIARRPLFFFSQARMKNYQFIKKINTEHDVFLSRNNDAGLLPAFTGCTVYMGNSILTPNASQKNAQIANLWASRQDIGDWLKDNKITYIFASRDYIPEFEQIKWLADQPYIEPVIDNDSFLLYKVRS
ncbi:MAG: hypothetical protein WC465_03610 [Patescibacteria group bacterium]